MRVDFAKQFTKDCHQLVIVSHAVSSWPSWRDQAFEKTIRCATGYSKLSRTSISVSKKSTEMMKRQFSISCANRFQCGTGYIRS
jgi:hypothetical protein